MVELSGIINQSLPVVHIEGVVIRKPGAVYQEGIPMQAMSHDEIGPGDSSAKLASGDRRDRSSLGTIAQTRHAQT